MEQRPQIRDGRAKMNWPESTLPTIVAFPRGRVRDGRKVGEVVAVQDNPLRWTSRYASLVTAWI